MPPILNISRKIRFDEYKFDSHNWFDEYKLDSHNWNAKFFETQFPNCLI